MKLFNKETPAELTHYIFAHDNGTRHAYAADSIDWATFKARNAAPGTMPVFLRKCTATEAAKINR